MTPRLLRRKSRREVLAPTPFEEQLRSEAGVLRFARPPVALEREPVAMAVRLTQEGPSDEVTHMLTGQTRAAVESAEWTLMADAGLVLDDDTLVWIGRAAATAPDADVITCDRDHLDHRGRRRSPRVRPGPSPDLLRSVASPHPLVAVRSSLLASLDLGAPGWRRALMLEAGDAMRHAHLPMTLAHTTPDATWDPLESTCRHASLSIL